MTLKHLDAPFDQRTLKTLVKARVLTVLKQEGGRTEYVLAQDNDLCRLFGIGVTPTSTNCPEWAHMHRALKAKKL